jgi:hypothetical protein
MRASLRYPRFLWELGMDEWSDETPLTVGMLRAALDACGQATGFALAGTLNTSGTHRSLILAIAESLQTLTVDGRFPGTTGHCMNGIVQGMQAFLISGEKEKDAPLL